MSDFHALQVSAIEKLTPSSVAVSFDVPETLKDTFSFKAGQYITIKHQVNGQELRRAYSISCPPSSGRLTVGIKKMPGGTFSVYANEGLREGATLEVMPPEGRFIFVPDGNPKNVIAFAAGSGITPIMSIAQTVLESHPENIFVLIFGNQSATETMYLSEIQFLENKYTDRFFIQHVYSRAQEDNALFGRIERSTVNFIIKNKFKNIAFDAHYLCGPEPMINTVVDVLKENGVSEEKILFELFTSSDTEDDLAEDLEGKTQVEVIVDDETFSFTMDKKQLVLDAVLKEDIDAPYSCQGGVCSSCIARIKEGKAEMVKNQILTDGEVAEGLILTCQAHPLTSKLKIDYDDV
ncbi:2Fe-2S iron-sulfur cluster binding domain-containing protein [Muricauda sp. JGD-17]|uniref:2Fe-2S iron-sulfur cluster binding domain-containing protein n=1 Tax=Flagellimonas ochracea TaxID=2696472 RepID=A0A964TB55_9FLAO|nr:ferredoxin--NADP reductase [Allomuricauda ochracea]NAY91622.1 2Fe-2S iron-sulfur cluster binding domain-containing protein [Allomuricauda ochracea]